MPRIDSEKFYTSAINTYGISPQGLNWTSKQTQEIRFKMLLKLLPLDLESLTDAGCGFGDFYNYLCLKKRIPKKYIGIDSLKEMHTIASKNTQQEIITANIIKDSIPHTDYYVCSGAMNILNTFETHLFIRNCFHASKKAFIFNVLHGEKDSQTYNYLSTSQIHSIATSLQVKKVIIEEGYLKNDVTVGFFHV